MSADKDVTRDVKKTGLVIAAVAFIAIAGGFLLLSWISTPPPAPTRIQVDKTAGGSGKPVPESDQYRAVRLANNEDGARQAQASNGSFISSVGTGPGRTVPPIDATPPPPRPDTAAPPRTAHQSISVVQAVDADRKKALEALLKELVLQRSAPAGQIATATGMTGGGAAGANPASVYATWTESLAPAAATEGLTGAPAGKSDRVIIPAGTRPGGIIDTAVDSDNTGSQVLARIPAGPYAGAVLMASGVRLAGDGVDIHFTRMTWDQDTWRVDVRAAMPDTLQSSVATTVNNRYGTRILLPALAHGLGLGGQLYASANTQILSNGYNTIEGRVGMPDGTAVAGTVLGGAAQQAGQVIAADAQKLPVKQVLVERGQAIALLFMTAVKESDKETGTPGAPAPGLRPPSVTQP